MAQTSTTATVSTPVGELFCQRNSFAKTLDATVVACTSVPLADGTPRYEVLLSDTVIFPTGGGQPSDVGTINGKQVLEAKRVGLQCVHILSEPLNVGEQVTVQVDWPRRFDHMQQHSGQHLLSAIAEQHYNLETVGWNLGKDKCYIELPSEPHPSVLESLERHVNSVIRQRLPVSVVEHGNLQGKDRPDSMPEDLVEGTVRYVSFGDVDQNACCGTHVEFSSDIQCIKLLHTERVRGGNCRVFFVAGERVFAMMQASLERERQLTGLLSAGPESFVDRVEKLKKDIKEFIKAAKKQSKALASAGIEDPTKAASGSTSGSASAPPAKSQRGAKNQTASVSAAELVGKPADAEPAAAVAVAVAAAASD